MFQEQTTDLAENLPPPARTRLLLLVHATFILMLLNFLVVLWFYISPNIGSMKGAKLAPQNWKAAVQKGSPFEPVRIEKSRKWSKLPPKLEPLAYETRSEEPGRAASESIN